MSEEFKIIIAAGNGAYRNNLASVLRLQGNVVEFCDGGFHVLSTIEQDPNIRMLILYENMSDMAAQEIISLVRLTKNKNELPVLYISKRKDEEEIKDIISSGANEYIVQAPGFHIIIDKVKKYR